MPPFVFLLLNVRTYTNGTFSPTMYELGEERRMKMTVIPSCTTTVHFLCELRFYGKSKAECCCAVLQPAPFFERTNVLLSAPLFWTVQYILYSVLTTVVHTLSFSRVPSYSPLLSSPPFPPPAPTLPFLQRLCELYKRDPTTFLEALYLTQISYLARIILHSNRFNLGIDMHC